MPEVGDYDIPPEECQLQDRCLILPLLRDAKQKEPIKGMERIFPVCAVCGAYWGKIDNEEISGLRSRMRGFADKVLGKNETN